MKTGQTRRVGRASLEESTRNALTTHQDVKIPDGTVVIYRELLQEIRGIIENEAIWGINIPCTELLDKLDSIYPFLKQPKCQ